MKSLWQKLQAAATLVALATLAVAQNSDTASGPKSSLGVSTQFTRITKDEEGRPAALQLAIVTYVPRDNPDSFSVDLVSAIHIGDRSYYVELNNRFQDYDALLYELVVQEGAALPKESPEGKGFLSSAQLMLGKFLDLSFQLDEIDYTASNFVHADLSSQELRQSMIDRDESLYVYFWRLYFAAMKDYADDPYGIDNMTTMLTSGAGYSLKIAFAYELTELNNVGDFLGGESGSALISDRNERALEILRLQFAARKKRVGIFYGAAHLPDMEQRLLHDFGFIRHKTVWIDAWQLGNLAHSSPIN